jgi:predicted negative regulator of RcsB-dependent stress response
LYPPASLVAKEKKASVDTRTRHALKQDKFALAAKSSASWLSENQSTVVRWSIVIGVVLVLVIGGMAFWSVRSSAANIALGAAVDVYTSPLAIPGAPPEPGAYTTAEARSKEANREFVAIAHNFSWLPGGAKARYFAGITYEELGQSGNAETELKAVAGSWNHNLANLAKLALAGLYQQTDRPDEAIDLYKQLTAKPSVTVSAGTAQLALADLYASQGKLDQARVLWAKVRDTDKDGAAGQIAAQKLTGQ